MTGGEGPGRKSFFPGRGCGGGAHERKKYYPAFGGRGSILVILLKRVTLLWGGSVTPGALKKRSQKEKNEKEGGG